MATNSRRVRIVCISDTHNQTPKLPSGDILIHAGDLTNQGSLSELQKTVKWLQQTSFPVKIIVCGNHDITCDVPFYQQHGGHFHNKKREDPYECLNLFHQDPTFIYLNHEAKVVRLDHQDGTFTLLKVFGSPYSPAQGFWAFGYKPEEAHQLWDQIPLDSDLIVAHTPAKFHRDQCGTRGTAGCQKLLQALGRVRPRLFVCGHIHEAYGVETVKWDFTSSSEHHLEQSVRSWEDTAPESKKQYLVDLSSRSQSPLDNDGSVEDDTSQMPSEELRHMESHSIPSVGQYPISGSKGRAETCIVNAAFMATNWPHKSGKKFHKPIVIDLDLPILQKSSYSPPTQEVSALEKV